MTIKAIETRYDGHLFRSRLEARWAVFYNALGIQWVYEPEGYELGDDMRYLPDFWLPDYDCFIEIKGTYPNREEQLKAHRLAKLSGKDVLIFWGKVGECPDPGAFIFFGWQPIPENDDESDEEFYSDNYYTWVVPSDEWSRSTARKHNRFDLAYGAESNYRDNSPEGIIEYTHILLAYDKANSARFEVIP